MVAKKLNFITKENGESVVRVGNNKSTSIPLRQRPTDIEVGWEDPVIDKMEENIKTDELQQQEQEQEQVEVPENKLDDNLIDFDEETKEIVKDAIIGKPISIKIEDNSDNENLDHMSKEELITYYENKMNEIRERKDNYTQEEIKYSESKFFGIFDNRPENIKDALLVGDIKVIGSYKGLNVYAQTSKLFNNNELFTETEGKEIATKCMSRFLSRYGQVAKDYSNQPEKWENKVRFIKYYMIDHLHNEQYYHTFLCRNELWICNATFVTFYNKRIRPEIIDEIKSKRLAQYQYYKAKIDELNGKKQDNLDIF